MKKINHAFAVLAILLLVIALFSLLIHDIDVASKDSGQHNVVNCSICQFISNYSFLITAYLVYCIILSYLSDAVLYISITKLQTQVAISDPRAPPLQ